MYTYLYTYVCISICLSLSLHLFIYIYIYIPCLVFGGLAPASPRRAGPDAFSLSQRCMSA